MNQEYQIVSQEVRRSLEAAPDNLAACAYLAEVLHLRIQRL